MMVMIGEALFVQGFLAVEVHSADQARLFKGFQVAVERDFIHVFVLRFQFGAELERRHRQLHLGHQLEELDPKRRDTQLLLTEEVLVKHDIEFSSGHSCIILGMESGD